MSEGGSGDAGRINKGRGRGRGSPKVQTPGQVAATPTTPGPSKAALRRPNSDTHHRLTNIASSGNVQNISAQEKTPESNFQWNVNASVFVPRFTEQQEPVQQVAVAEELTYQENYDDPDAVALSTMFYTLDMLTKNPGSFYEYMTPLLKDLSCNITNQDSFEQIIEMLFTKAISEQNFQYMAARICIHFANHLTFSVAMKDNFRQLLLKRCQREHNNSQSNMETGQVARVRGFTIFMGELLVNMKVNNSYMTPLTNPLHGLLQMLLSQPSDDNFKCIAMVLKLCGAALDDVNSQMMSALLDKIQIQANHSTSVKRHIVEMLLKLVTLRSNNWGRAESPQPAPDSTYNLINAAAPYEQPDPVFYNAHGQPISRQEAGFSVDEYNNFTVGNEYTAWSNTDDSYYDEDISQEMDEEMAEAYEQFLSETQGRPGH